ncbi:type III-A CRISPR-associated protein Cas10/Csm1 [Caminibacter pacificus]
MRENEKIALAAFLHDIGKFRQRYEFETQKKSKNIKEYYQFFLEKNEFLPEFEELIKAVFEQDIPEEKEKAIMWIADKIAKGDFEEESYQLNPQNLQTPLRHIFNEQKFFNIEKLSCNSIFPVDNINGNYENLWKEFERDLNEIKEIFRNKEDVNHLKLDAFEYLFRKYTSLIPNRLDKNSDSLYEHLRMSAMFAGVIGSMEDVDEYIKEVKNQNFEKERFLLIAGDFFGIQNFIFDEVKTKYAAKTLRAKSAYIQILVKVLAFYIVNKLNLPRFSIISTHAGKFEILAPNSDDIIKKLENIKKEFNEFFLSRFFGETGVGITYVPASTKDFLDENSYKEFRKRLADEVEELKFKKFNLHKIREKIFEYDEDVNNQNLCEFCQKRKGKESKENYVICDICNHYIEIGKSLVSNRFLAISKEAKDDSDIEIFKGFYIHFFDNPSSVKLKNDVALYDIVTDEEFRGYEKWELSSYVAVKDKFNKYKDYFKSKNKEFFESQILTLEELAAISVTQGIVDNKREKGVEAIMALKGDADGMGNFIKNSKVTSSFVKFNFFARMVDYYFSVYVPITFMKDKPFYTVFAGGDDLFVLGAWNEIIDLSIKVRDDFKKFTDNNLSFSTGLVMSKSNKPVSFIAEIAEHQLENAKDFCCEKKEDSCYKVKECDENKHIKKDAVTLFGYSMNWDVLKRVRAEVIKAFNNFEQKYEVKTTMLYKLLNLADMRIALIEPNKENINEFLKNSLWKSKLSYFYRRNISEDDNELLDKLNKWIEDTPKEFKVSLFEYIYKKRSKV